MGKVGELIHTFYEDVAKDVRGFQTINWNNRVSDSGISSSKAISLLDTIASNNVVFFNSKPLQPGVVRGTYGKQLVKEQTSKIVIIEVFDDVFSRIGIESPKVIDYEEEILRRKEAARKNGAKNRKSRGGIFNYEAFLSPATGSSNKATLTEILGKISDQSKIAWYVGSVHDYESIMYKMRIVARDAQTFGVKFPYVAISTCESVWKAHSAKFPNNEVKVEQVLKDANEAIAKKVSKIQIYEDIASWRMDSVKKAVAVMKKRLADDHILIKYFDEVFDNFKATENIRNSPTLRSYAKQCTLRQSDKRFNGIEKKYELLFVRNFDFLQEEPEAIARYINLVDLKKE